MHLNITQSAVGKEVANARAETYLINPLHLPIKRLKTSLGLTVALGFGLILGAKLLDALRANELPVVHGMERRLKTHPFFLSERTKFVDLVS